MRAAPARSSPVARLARVAFGVYALAVGLFVVVPVAAVALALCRTRRAVWRIGGRMLRFAGAVTGLGPDVRLAPGAALPAGACVVVSNHASLLDILALIAASGEPLTFTSKREVFGWPLIGRFARKFGAIPVERGSIRRRAEALGAAAAAVAAGETLHVFPEATFSPGPGLLQFRLGAFRIATEAGVPIVPVALLGTRGCLPPGALLPRPGRVEVRVLPPLEPPPEADGFRALSAFRDHVRSVLAEAVADGPQGRV